MTKKILAIDTSCDDTAVAVAEMRNGKINIPSNTVSSQVKLHAEYGGIYPTLAKREHQLNLPVVLEQSLRESGLLKTKKVKIEDKTLKEINKILAREELLRPLALRFLENHQKPDIAAVAVTVGPGLEPCLWVGVNFAKALAFYWKLPVIPVNHLEAHLLANFINHKSPGKKIFPSLGLVVSGGNTQLFLMKEIGKYKLLGETRDDAAGECFDKTARILGLGYPGGPAISKLARQGTSSKIQINLPRPMINTKDYDFSFSGLKTAVLYDYKKRSKAVRNSKEYKIAMARDIQQAVIDVLIKKTLRGVQEYGVKCVIMGGGVGANDELQEQFKAKLAALKINSVFMVPAKSLCTDNAAMVGAAACFHLRNKRQWKHIKAKANMA